MAMKRVLGTSVRIERIWHEPHYLARWLNEPGQAPEKKRIVALIEMIHDALVMKDGRETVVPDQAKLTPINDAVARYVGGAPQIALRAVFEGRLDFEYSTPKRVRGFPDEWYAFAFVWSLVKERRILTLRRCQFSGCRRWYLARVDDQKYCPKPARCKKKAKAQTPEFKKHRSEYMKDYYEKWLSTRSVRLRARKTKGSRRTR